MPQLEPVDYTPDFGLTTEQKAPAISIKTPVDHVPEFEDASPPVANAPAANSPSAMDRIFGLNGTERYQFWPEKMVRAAVDAPRAALAGELKQNPTEEDPSGGMKEIAAAQDVMNLVGSGAVTARPGMGMAGGKMIQPATAEAAPVFYSAVEHTIQNARQPQASGDQWLGALMNSPGVKAEELEWTGVADFLAQRQAEGKPVTKQELQDHIAQNKVEVQSVQPKGGDDYHAYDEHMGDVFDHLIGHAKPNEVTVVPNGNQFDVKVGDYVLSRASRRQDARDQAQKVKDDIRSGNEDGLREWADESANIMNEDGGGKGPNGQRYAEYQFPGGENYNEMVLTLPARGREDAPAFSVPGHGTYADRETALSYMKNNKIPGEPISVTGKGMGKNQDYQSSHWDEPNILAHVRFNDRTIDGKKTLFLEEVQSDWHQQGREHGYLDKTGMSSKDRKPGATRPAVPDAPFKKTWPELVMKRMLKKAADEGYEQIAWTPGKVQNERYAGRGKDEEAGMAKFYDEILPNVANKLGKKFGAKVGEAVADTPRGGTNKLSNQEKVHTMPITPELAQTAGAKGFPLFSTGLPFMFTPVDHNPFEDDK